MKLNYAIDRRLYPHNSSMYEVYFDQSVLISSFILLKKVKIDKRSDP